MLFEQELPQKHLTKILALNADNIYSFLYCQVHYIARYSNTGVKSTGLDSELRFSTAGETVPTWIQYPAQSRERWRSTSPVHPEQLSKHDKHDVASLDGSFDPMAYLKQL